MPDATINLSSIMLASVSAGPLFFLGIGVGTVSADPATPVPISLDWAIGLAVPVLALSAAFFGSVIALLPNLIGSALMISIGNRNEAARMPVIWMVAGALAGAIPVMAMESGSSGARPATVIALAFTGGCCALICRYRVEW